MEKDLENFSGKFRERNNFDYLYSDAMYLKSKENFQTMAWCMRFFN